MKKSFFSTWLVLGLSQIILGLGCDYSYAFQEDTLFSSGNGSESEKDFQMPVRIPRNYLDEHRISGSIMISEDESNSLPLEISSSATWNQKPTTLPPPVRAAQADYRDFEGCLEFPSFDNVAICFNVMPDVSSVGVNPQEMKLQGMEKFINRQLAEVTAMNRCPVQAGTIRLVRADRKDDLFIIHLAGPIREDNGAQAEWEAPSPQQQDYSSSQCGKTKLNIVLELKKEP